MTRLLSLLFLAVLAACGVSPGHQAPYASKVGKPYKINGHWYAPDYDAHYDEIGVASWYGPGFHGGRTASGERYDQDAMTAAHRTLPLPSIVRVTNLDNGKSALVTVNDRGPFAHDRIIDLSRAAAQTLGVWRTGTAKVRVQFLDAETKQYVQNLRQGKSYAMAAVQNVDPVAAGAREEARPGPEISALQDPFTGLEEDTVTQTSSLQPATQVPPVPELAPSQDIFSVVEEAQAAPASVPPTAPYAAPAHTSHR